ncbi:GH3 family domain-containing protein [Tahibacter harae]|uniref:GH3 auxin-responsive promoter family protein n=1 Tax=Tahibacter harae TaxID=2963937 RepID=A0ABT1QZI1_9GAMM|nr:GH3 auxin-responsive promoter family protein [Tahibacter harae]
MFARLAAPLLRALCAPRAQRFDAALDDPATAQAAALARMVRAGAATQYARAHGLRADDGMAEFRSKIPLCTYAELAPWIARQQAEPGGAVLTPGRVRCHEPTSGSGGTVKRIPYNTALLRSFRSLFAIWAADLLRHSLRPRSGRLFASVSPRLGAAAQGLADDRDYLGPAQRLLLGRFLLTPPGGAADLAQFRHRLAVTLLSCAELEVISIWNPSYLLVLLDWVEQREDSLLQQLPARPRRVLENEADPWPLLWPRLQLVSCWTAAAAAAPARQLARRLPQAQLQGKGLLATEAPLTLPLHGAGGCVPLLDEVFLEFEEAGGGCRLLHELEADGEYGLVVTQPGGLLRYRLGDRVRCSGFYRATPLLEFLGRSDAVADLVGEKLHEDSAAQALQAVFGDGPALLLPLQPAQGQPYYLCLAENAPAGAAAALDAQLCKALRYAEARALEQLRSVQVIVLPQLRAQLLDYWSGAGLRLGDIKDRRLLVRVDTARDLAVAFGVAGK